MRILVTGGAGFIGSHLVERLLKAEHHVVCVDNFDSYYDPAIKWKNIERVRTSPRFQLFQSDIRNTVVLNHIFAESHIDIVVHLGARAGVRPSILQPELYYDVNVHGTLRLLEAMRGAGVRKLVFGSSSSVYGNNSKVPFSESDNVDHPISPYAASKKAAELLCHTYHYLYGFDIFCLRFFTVFGPRQRPDMAIHQFLRKVLAGETITLYGDGTSRRDYTYIDDILQGVLRSIERVSGYEVINLGESRTVSLLDLIRVIEEVTGKKAAIEWKPMQAGDVHQTYADIRKAKSTLEYAPAFALEEGIREFYRWYSSEYPAS